MKKTLFLFVLLATTSVANCQFLTFEHLDQEIAKKQQFQAVKEDRIASLKSLLKGSDHQYDLQHSIYTRIFHEYQRYIYDSALHYARLTALVSRKSKRPEHVNLARLNQAFALVSAGIFEQATDTLNVVDRILLSDSIKVEYFDLLARCWLERAEYIQDDYYAPMYRDSGRRMVDSALYYSDPGSVKFQLIKAGQLMHDGGHDSAISMYEHILNQVHLDLPTKAVTSMLLSTAYGWVGRTEASQAMLIQAAIADAQGAIKETVATRVLAEQLFKNGNLEKAKFYINESLADAEFYGARFRRSQLAQIAPLIEAQRSQAIERESLVLKRYNLVISLFIVVVAVFAGWSFVQYRKLKKARVKLDLSYQKVREFNQQLGEVNEIKDEYIGQFFDVISDYIEQIKKFKFSVGKKAMAKQTDEVLAIVDKIDLKKEREALNLSFDQTFVKIYPNFISEWNRLVAKEYAFDYHEGKSLSPEIRIFALIKLGISDHEKIAKILDYSVNTIYSYKTKIKNNAVVAKEDFEGLILAIGK